MDTTPAWNLLRVIRAAMLTFFTIVFAGLFGGAMLPLTHNFVVDALVWLALTGGVAVWHVRAAYRYTRREAAEFGHHLGVLQTLAEVAYEVMGLVAGGFFGALFAALTVQEYRKTAFGGDTPLMLGLCVLSLGGFAFCVRRALRYVRAERAAP